MRQIELFRKGIDKEYAKLTFKRFRDESFDFKEIPASSGVYGIHPYPAMFHFLVVRKLLKEFSKRGDFVLDPFMGSGVSAVECLISGRNFIGYDINPLAVLIAKVRTTPIKSNLLLEVLEHIIQDFKNQKPEFLEFDNIYYWFDKEVVKDLSRLRQSIFKIEDSVARDFFKVVFSDTVRRVSKARYDEFKLVRKRENNSIRVLKIFKEIALKNIGLLVRFYENFPPTKTILILEERDILNGIPLEDESIDLVITSPPYGDSRTTVAYGQFSKLPLRWLGIEKDVDKVSLGAKIREIHYNLPSEILYKYIEKIAIEDRKRAKEVFSYYEDLYYSIRIISQKVKRDGLVCFVVGNRKVKGLELPTDKISVDFFSAEGFEHQITIIREISRKRMPHKNSPSNIRGIKDSTMKYEYIVILKKLN